MTLVNLIIPPAGYPASLGYQRYMHAPLESITSLRSVLIHAGHEVCVHDYRAESVDNALADLSTSISPQSGLIGFTCLFDSFHFIERAIPLVRNICFRSTIVVGGPTPSALPEVFLREANADIVALGEAEISIVAIAESLNCVDMYDRIPGIAWRSPDGAYVRSMSMKAVECLDDLPACDWSYADLSKPLSPMYSAGRGCPRGCTFCSKHLGPKRLRSVKRFRQDLSYLRQVLGNKPLLFVDSDFLHDNPHLLEYCSILKEMSWEWGCFAAPFDLTPDLLDHLFRCGCTNIRIGVEAHDEDMIRRHRLGFSLSEMNRVLEILEASPIPHLTYYYALGLPGQTPESLDTILKEVRRRRRIIPRAFHLLPLPGTNVFHLAIQQGLIEDITEFLRFLESVRLDEASNALPNLSACTRSLLATTYQELSYIITERSNAIGTSIFP
jgi:radical SAM superfamily enzyme YgiQ (UPF0313 family)